MSEGESRATCRAKRSDRLLSRLEANRVTLDDPKLSWANAEPRDERRTSCPATDRAVAIRLVKWRAVCFITDCAARTTACEQHDRSFVKGLDAKLFVMPNEPEMLCNLVVKRYGGAVGLLRVPIDASTA